MTARFQNLRTKIIFMIPLIAGVFFGSPSKAQVTLPEDELAKESVVPKFDNATTIKARNVVLSHKFEASVYYGWNFAEAIENQSKIGFNLGYHWDEFNALVLNYAQWTSGLNTQYTSSLLSKYNLDYTRAPALQSSLWLNYEWTLYYGKISLAKQAVMNLSIYPIFGAGTTAYSNKSYYGVNAGIGAKFYFTPHWALQTDFKVQYSGEPSPYLSGYMQTSQPVPSKSQFADTYAVGTVLDVGLAAVF